MRKFLNLIQFQLLTNKYPSITFCSYIYQCSLTSCFFIHIHAIHFGQPKGHTIYLLVLRIIISVAFDLSFKMKQTES